MQKSRWQLSQPLARLLAPQEGLADQASRAGSDRSERHSAEGTVALGWVGEDALCGQITAGQRQRTSRLDL